MDSKEIKKLGKELMFAFTVEEELGIVDCGKCCLDGADMLLIESYFADCTITFTPITKKYEKV